MFNDGMGPGPMGGPGMPPPPPPWFWGPMGPPHHHHHHHHEKEQKHYEPDFNNIDSSNDKTRPMTVARDGWAGVIFGPMFSKEKRRKRKEEKLKQKEVKINSRNVSHVAKDGNIVEEEFDPIQNYESKKRR